MAEKFTPMHYIVVILVVAMAVSVTAVAWNFPEPATVSVSGYSEMLADPNEAHVYLGVTSQALTAGEAQQVTATTIGTVIVAMKQTGVPEANIETYYISISPRYDWESGRQDIVGYDATHMLKAKVSDLDAVGDVISAAVAAGSNRMDSIDYTVDKVTEASLRRSLLAEAAKDARQKAEGLSASLGVSIVRVRSASESVSFVPYKAAVAETALAGGDIVPPGKVELSGTASVVYEIA
jgi:uncharacterized protein YggE